MIFAQDHQGRFLLVNQATALAYGKKPEELIGVKRKDIHPVAEEVEIFLKDNRDVWASGKPVLRANESFTDILGRKHTLESIKIPLKMAGTEKKAVLGVAVDMTEQKKVEDFRNDVVRTISHELRTPLSIEKGAITLVLDGLAGGEVNAKQRELLLMVLHNIERLSRLIDNLLDVSRIEAGKLKVRPRDEDLAAIVRDAVFENKKRASDKNLQLKMSLPETAAEVHVDRDKIFQVVSNLIDNALKFTEQGVIELSVKVFENEVECSVQDTGVGMTQQSMEKVFEKFHQFSRIPGAGEKGLGLGLAICKGFVEAHGGKIWVKSHSGMGTCVTFVLPRRRSKEIPSEKGA
jgi:PAS domain S-box-containing protein